MNAITGTLVTLYVFDLSNTFWFKESLVYESKHTACAMLHVFDSMKRTSSKEPFVYKSHAIFLVLYLKKKCKSACVMNWITFVVVLCACNQSNQIYPLF